MEKLLIKINFIIALCYLGMAVMVVSRFLYGETEWFGSIILICVLIALAIGHACNDIWAIKVSAAIFTVINIFAIPYLFGWYDSEIILPFKVRIINFSIITILDTFLLINYIFRMRLNKSIRSS
jgi:hypothetical protein